MKIKSGFVVRTVGGEHVAVPVGERAKHFHGMLSLNDSGAFLWSFFSEDKTKEDAVSALLEEYAVEKEIAQKDVDEFIAVLEKNGFLE